MKTVSTLSIGDVAQRTGLTVSAIRFYEERGLVKADRSSGGQRRFERSDIRRLSFVQIVQQLGFSIEQIGDVLQKLPKSRTPTKRDWTLISQDFRKDLDKRIAILERLRDKLDSCIGCGCLSLENCALYNPADRASLKGTGARFVLTNEKVGPEKERA